MIVLGDIALQGRARARGAYTVQDAGEHKTDREDLTQNEEIVTIADNLDWLL